MILTWIGSLELHQNRDLMIGAVESVAVESVGAAKTFFFFLFFFFSFSFLTHHQDGDQRPKGLLPSILAMRVG